MTILQPLQDKLDTQDLRLESLEELVGSLMMQSEILDKRITQIEKPSPKPFPKLEVRRKLTLPVDKDGNFFGKAHEIPWDQLQSYSDTYYFKDIDGSQVYNSPAIGATTENAKFPRTENRYYLFDPELPLRDDGFDTMTNWKRGQMGELNISFKINTLDPAGKVVIAQSHAVNAPPDWKCVLDGGGDIRLLCKLTDGKDVKDTVFFLAKDIDQGANRHDLYFRFDGITLNASYNGNFILPIVFDKKTDWYLKDGLYIASAHPASITHFAV